MSTAIGTRQQSDTVVCVWNKVLYCDVERRSIATVMEDAGFWEADLIAMDFSVGNKRRGPCDLQFNKDKDVVLKFLVVHIQYRIWIIRVKVHRKPKV